MAAITTANVVKTRSFEHGDRGGAMVEVVKDLVITLSAQGATIGDIPAAALGMAKIYTVLAYGLNVGGLIKGVVVSCAIDGSELIPMDLNQATDANRRDRANITGDLYVRVSGSQSL